jgi:RND superfamily putative drug exporter
MALLSQVVNLSIFSLNLATMLGLGLGIDYSLFVVSRFREELAAGRSVEQSVAWAVAMAGRAVLYSGATVAIGLLALLTFDITALRSMGVAGALVVTVSLLAALTLLPAVLSVLGGRIDALAIGPLSAAAARRPDGNGFWTHLARQVMARPLLVLIPLLALLLGLGLPFLHVEFGAPDASILPADVQSRRGFELLRQHWGDGELSPVILVFAAQDGGYPLRPDLTPGLVEFMRRVEADPAVSRVSSPVSLDPRLTPEQYQLLYADPEHIADAYARVAVESAVRQDVVLGLVTSRYGQTDTRSKALVRAIRATPPPPGFKLLVGGGTAGVLDYADRLYEQFPRAAILVVVATYLVLLRTFGSLVIPLKAVIMNALSILASYGALVVVFQDGALADVLRFQPLGFVEASLPILMFCVLFGLSMDYEVFLLTRIQEAHLAGEDNVTSVVRGLERSGRIITSAAGIVVLVSLSFVAADIVLIKALGLGTAIAVLLDATLVRALLVPATMRLLGEWNWWAPAWLRPWLRSGSLRASR